MSGDEGENIWWNEMRTIVHTYGRLRRASGMVRGRYSFSLMALRSLLKKTTKKGSSGYYKA